MLTIGNLAYDILESWGKIRLFQIQISFLGIELTCKPKCCFLSSVKYRNNQISKKIDKAIIIRQKFSTTSSFNPSTRENYGDVYIAQLILV
jgi:hypothetical protein